MSTGRVICYCPKPELQLGNVWNAKFSILFSCLFRLNVCCVVMMEKYFWDSPHLFVSNIVRARQATDALICVLHRSADAFL
jgi:hypothetical protein